LMRAEKTPEGGMKGVLMSVTEGDLVPYLVKMDAAGRELSREALPAPAGRAGGGGAVGGGRAGGAGAGRAAAPAAGGGGPGGGANGRTIPDVEKDGYGQIGFYVGGTGEVHIKDFMYKDILNHTWAPEETGKNFKEIRVDPHYYSWSTAVADFNHDGAIDIAAG